MILGMMGGATATPKLTRFSKAKVDLFAGIGMGASIVYMYITVMIENTAARIVLLTLSIFLVGVGVGGGIINVIDGGCIMRVAPKDMLGRVSGLHYAIMEASMPVGSFLCSALVLRLSVVRLFLMFGVCTILFYAYMGLTHKLKYLDASS